MADRVAVITGSGTGIGRASALALMNDGWSVVLCGRRKEMLEETASMKTGGKALIVPTDVTEPEGVPRHLPSLLRAHSLQERAARVGFDWSRIDEALPKLDEEMAEFKESLKKEDAAGIEEELGDIFFMLVNISRFLGINPEDALRKTISKFIRRFRYIEENAADAGKPLSDMTLDEMEMLWQEAKRK